MLKHPNKGLQNDVNRLVQQKRRSNSTPTTRQEREGISSVVGVGFRGSAGEASGSGGGSGLTPPLTMIVTKTKTITIPVPAGSTSVDVQVVEEYTLKDSASTQVVLPVAILDYPPA